MSRRRITNYVAFIAAMIWGHLTFAQPTFTDITAQAGIDHHHKGFLYGGGVACGDFNNDGFLDLYIPNGKGARNRLYMNNGNLTFSDRAPTSGVADDTSEGIGAVCGDLDNDGDLDIYVANHYDENKLYINDGNAHFVDVTASAGVGDPGPSTSVALSDYDNDGYLDIYVLNRSPGNEAYVNRLYRNNGDGTFSDVTQQANVGYVGQSLGVGFFDYDNDGDSDIYVVDEFAVDALYRNNGDGTFINMADSVNIPIGEGMGVDFADYDNDGDFDIYVANYLKDYLLRNNGDGTFTNVADQIGIINYGIGWGVNFFDYDNDGDGDVYVVNGGMIYEARDKPNPFYRNHGDGTFTDIASEYGLDYTGDGRGSVCADFNNDGYVDLFFVNVLRGKSVLYLNNGGDNNWITLKLVGTQSNRSAVGARVEVVTGTLKQIAEVRAGSSYASMHSLDLEFGLGEMNVVDSITIHWPSGIVQQLTNIDANQILSITEPGDIVSVTSPDRDSNVNPNELSLLNNFPNPFNTTTTIIYQLTRPAIVNLSIYTVAGQLVGKLVDEYKFTGSHSVVWNASKVSSGVYIVQLVTPQFSKSIKMVFLK